MAEPPATSLDDADPDQILNDWTLTAVDLEEIGRARGPDNRLWRALHLCSLRRTGRFTDTPETVPQGAVAHLARQLAIVPPAQLALLDRQPTDSAIRARVRDHLGFVPFSLAAQNRLETELAGMASDGLGGTDLLRRAEAILYAAKIVLPAASTLERLVASINRQALEGLYARIAARLPSSLRDALDQLAGQLSDDTESGQRTALGRYRTPSAASMGALPAKPAGGWTRSRPC